MAVTLQRPRPFRISFEIETVGAVNANDLIAATVAIQAAKVLLTSLAFNVNSHHVDCLTIMNDYTTIHANMPHELTSE